ncbi:MAG: lysine transporter LysE [Sphingobacteriia bacterium]|jgi:threonine/homoserine/homoserine lactone efflux protein|nr:MAG: lysine transporter LysE [Sphingobacteriia bacterium]
MWIPIGKGLLLGMVLSISVGPVIFAIIKQSLTNGHKAGYAFVLGVSASDVSMVLLTNFFTSLFSVALSHQRTIALLGSLFLVSVGIFSLFFKKKSAFLDPSAQAIKQYRKRDLLGIAASGYFMNLLNPAVFLFWFAASAAIIGDAASAASPASYKLAVFLTCLVFVLLSDVLKVYFAAKLRLRLTAANMLWITRLSGIIMIVFGVVLGWSAYTNQLPTE